MGARARAVGGLSSTTAALYLHLMNTAPPAAGELPFPAGDWPKATDYDLFCGLPSILCPGSLSERHSLSFCWQELSEVNIFISLDFFHQLFWQCW